MLPGDPSHWGGTSRSEGGIIHINIYIYIDIVVINYNLSYTTYIIGLFHAVLTHSRHRHHDGHGMSVDGEVGKHGLHLFVDQPGDDMLKTAPRYQGLF